MSLNRLVPEPYTNPPTPSRSTSPDYAGLVRFLIQPFLEAPDSLRVDCEFYPSKLRVWIRLAFEGEDKGRIFGRGGRNIQAIRTVLDAAARATGESIYLDIYGSQGIGRDSEFHTGDSPGRPSREHSRRVGAPKPPSRSRSQ